MMTQELLLNMLKVIHARTNLTPEERAKVGQLIIEGERLLQTANKAIDLSMLTQHNVPGSKVF